MDKGPLRAIGDLPLEKAGWRCHQPNVFWDTRTWSTWNQRSKNAYVLASDTTRLTARQTKDNISDSRITVRNAFDQGKSFVTRRVAKKTDLGTLLRGGDTPKICQEIRPFLGQNPCVFRFPCFKLKVLLGVRSQSLLCRYRDDGFFWGGTNMKRLWIAAIAAGLCVTALATARATTVDIQGLNGWTDMPVASWSGWGYNPQTPTPPLWVSNAMNHTPGGNAALAIGLPEYPGDTYPAIPFQQSWTNTSTTALVDISFYLYLPTSSGPMSWVWGTNSGDNIWGGCYCHQTYDPYPPGFGDQCSSGAVAARPLITVVAGPHI